MGMSDVTAPRPTTQNAVNPLSPSFTPSPKKPGRRLGPPSRFHSSLVHSFTDSNLGSTDRPRPQGQLAFTEPFSPHGACLAFRCKCRSSNVCALRRYIYLSVKPQQVSGKSGQDTKKNLCMYVLSSRTKHAIPVPGSRRPGPDKQTARSHPASTPASVLHQLLLLPHTTPGQIKQSNNQAVCACLVPGQSFASRQVANIYGDQVKYIIHPSVYQRSPTRRQLSNPPAFMGSHKRSLCAENPSTACRLNAVRFQVSAWILTLQSVQRHSFLISLFHHYRDVKRPRSPKQHNT